MTISSPDSTPASATSSATPDLSSTPSPPNVAEGPQSFAALGLSPQACAAAAAAGFSKPTSIQQSVIPTLAAGRDALLVGPTGSGKTAAFLLPIMSQLEQAEAEAAGERTPRVLVLAPTRDLATQTAGVSRQLGRHMGLRTRVVCGGLDRQRQVEGLAGGVDVVVGTIGRILDLAQQGALVLDGVTHLVLDEADRLLDDEFSEAMTALAPYLENRQQTVFCSATLQPGFMDFARTVTRNPVQLDLTVDAPLPATIRQQAMFINQAVREGALPAILAKLQAGQRHDGRKGGTAGGASRTIVFVNTKREARRLNDLLARAGQDSVALHGDLAQGARKAALAHFSQAPAGVLVTTDVAARGLDIDGVGQVINMGLPASAELYIHRIGRTARAGRRGNALSLLSPEDRFALREVERRTGQKVRIVPAPA
ncbi:DEAD/DEAH box helicase [Formicincola oecophyllae]|uniref:DEAD/DEAH box helicase n=1 Tax=Formicincola oecophyllae TaxID=2558361 RepID=A0A4Y6UAP0_9PROT|nr:DEAD/DEAH box helicase [Formicincola oecophyllae]QDH14010.1 DEAD/DEAH box helicase [Formicincola oecophyllae]